MEPEVESITPKGRAKEKNWALLTTCVLVHQARPEHRSISEPFSSVSQELPPPLMFVFFCLIWFIIFFSFTTNIFLNGDGRQAGFEII